MGSMGQPLCPGTCLLLCFLAQLAATGSGDRGRVGQRGKSLWWGMLGLVSLPWGSPGVVLLPLRIPANGNPPSHLRVP